MDMGPVTKSMDDTNDTIVNTTEPREIVITNDALEFGNIEAWSNVIASYGQKHPDHQVIILYEGEVVHSVITLFKRSPNLNTHGFKLVVAAPDSNWKDVPKLYRYLVEGAGPNFNRFIHREIHQVLKLF